MKFQWLRLAVVAFVSSVSPVVFASVERDQRAQILETRTVGLLSPTLRRLNEVYERTPELRGAIPGFVKGNVQPKLGEMIRFRRVYFTGSGPEQAFNRSVISFVEKALPAPLRMGMTELEIDIYLETGVVPETLPASSLLENLSIPLGLALQLSKHGYHFIEDVLKTTGADLQRLEAFGPIRLMTLTSALALHGHRLFADALERRIAGSPNRGARRIDDLGLAPNHARMMEDWGIETVEDLRDLSRHEISYLVRQGVMRVRADGDVLRRELVAQGISLYADPIERAERGGGDLRGDLELRRFILLQPWEFAFLQRYGVTNAREFHAFWTDRGRPDAQWIRESSALSGAVERFDEVARRLGVLFQAAARHGPAARGQSGYTAPIEHAERTGIGLALDLGIRHVVILEEPAYELLGAHGVTDVRSFLRIWRDTQRPEARTLRASVELRSYRAELDQVARRVGALFTRHSRLLCRDYFATTGRL